MKEKLKVVGKTILKESTAILLVAYGVLLLLALLFFISQMTLLSQGTYSNWESSGFDSGWTYEYNGKTGIVDEHDLDVEAGTSFTIINQVPADLDSEKTIAFFSTHQTVYVYLDDELCYYFDSPVGVTTKSPGNTWNFVELPADSAGKTIEIVFMSNYSANSGNVPSIVIGDYISILMGIVTDNIWSLIMCLVMITIGIGTILCWIFFRNRYSFERNFLCMGAITILCGIWGILETHVLSISIGHALAISNLAFICLIFASFPFVMFLKYTYTLSNKERAAINIISLMNLIIPVVLFTLKLTNVLDFKESAVMTHLTLAAAFVSTTVFLIRVIIRNSDEERFMATIHIICVCIIAVSFIADSTLYYVAVPVDAGFFSRIGMFIFSIVIFAICIRKSLRLIREGHEAEHIKYVAYHDNLTGLENRAAYVEKIEMLNRTDPSNYGVVMFDINELKEVNDVYGHHMGDYYMTVCSEIISFVFGVEGTVYRVGGDEFCAVMPNFSQIKFNDCFSKMEILTKNKTLPDTKVTIRVAFGFAVFDEKLDGDLFMTANRADIEMYKHKRILKEAEFV